VLVLVAKEVPFLLWTAAGQLQRPELARVREGDGSLLKIEVAIIFCELGQQVDNSVSHGRVVVQFRAQPRQRGMQSVRLLRLVEDAFRIVTEHA
jgi:hypothetical protein